MRRRRRVGKTKSQMHRTAKSKGSKRKGIQLTFNKRHNVPTNPGNRKAFSTKRRSHRG
jgi:hypothetical protein